MKNKIKGTYFLPDLWHLHGTKDAAKAVERVKGLNHWKDLMYLNLVMNLRDFERNEIPKMKDAIGFCLPFLGSAGFAMAGILGGFSRYLDVPEKDPEEIELEDRCYEMWNELDKLTFTLED